MAEPDREQIEKLFDLIRSRYADQERVERFRIALRDADALAAEVGVPVESVRLYLERASETYHFPARELPIGATFVRADELRLGEAYFYFGFEDDEGMVPVVRPYVFAGLQTFDDGETLAEFQDPRSFAAGVRSGDGPDDGEAEFFFSSLRGIHLCSFEVMLESVMLLALERARPPRAGSTVVLPSGATIEVSGHSYLGRNLMYNLRYYTQCDLADSAALQRELHEVWEHHERHNRLEGFSYAAVTAAKKPQFVGQVCPFPVSLAFRKDGGHWVAFDWSLHDELPYPADAVEDARNGGEE